MSGRQALELISRDGTTRNLSPVYREALQETARRFFGFVSKPASRIGKEDVLRYLAERGRTLSPASHVFEATKLRAVLRVLAPALVEVVSVKPAAPLPQLVHGEQDVQALLSRRRRGPDSSSRGRRRSRSGTGRFSSCSTGPGSVHGRRERRGCST